MRRGRNCGRRWGSFMATKFTKIMEGEIAGFLVYKDDVCAAFLDVNPVNPGHVLVVPRAEVDVLWDLEEGIYNHLWTVCRKLEPAIKKATLAKRVGVAVEGFGVPHVHIHLVPLHAGNDLDPHRAKKATAEELRQMQGRILEGMG